MTYTNFESDIDPTILERGKDYFLQGLVHDLVKENGHWYATVEGTHSYEVAIKGIRSIRAVGCDCPYDQGLFCKHLVAVMFAVREQMATDKANKTKKKKGKQPIDEIFKNAEPADLLAFFKKNLRYHKDLKQKLLAEFLHVLGEADPDRYRRVVDDILKNARSSRGYIEFRAAKQLSKAFDRLLEQAEAAVLKKNYVDALAITQALLERIPNLLHHVDDSYGYLQGAFGRGAEVIWSLLDAPIAPMFRDEIFDAVVSIYKADQTSFDLSKDLLSTMIDQDLEDEQYELLETIFMKELEQLDGEYAEYSQPFYINTLLLLYDNMDAHEKTEVLLKTYIHLPVAREKVIIGLIEEQDYTQAKQLLQAGIDIAVAKNHTGTVKRWEDLAMQISSAEGTPEELQKQLTAAFIKFRDIEYFTQLKKLASPEHWPEIKADFITIFSQKNRWGHTQNKGTLAEIFIHE